MFGEKDPYEDEIKYMLDNVLFEDILDELDITKEKVLEILLTEGYVKLPDWAITIGPYAYIEEDDVE